MAAPTSPQNVPLDSMSLLATCFHRFQENLIQALDRNFKSQSQIKQAAAASSKNKKGTILRQQQSPEVSFFFIFHFQIFF
jgi:hypothetical protein